MVQNSRVVSRLFSHACLGHARPILGILTPMLIVSFGSGPDDATDILLARFQPEPDPDPNHATRLESPEKYMCFMPLALIG